MKEVKIIWGYSADSRNGIWRNSETPEYVFHVDNFRELSNYPDSKNILILYEPKSILPHNYSYLLSNTDSINFAFTHRIDICDNNKIINMPPFFPSWINSESSKIYVKKKLVSMIASNKIMCDGHRYRQLIADRFPYKNDLFGRGRNFIENKLDGLRDYMFSVAMENEVCDTYYTEKILDCFLTGSIPIYWGTRKITDVFNKDGIIFLDELNLNDLSPDLYYSKIEAVIDNYNRATDLKSSSDDMMDYVIETIS